MSKTHVRSLNDNQLVTLLAIYSLRFSTRSVLSGYLNIANNTSLYSRLQILQKHGYIASHYHKSYKLAGREAEYYLLPKGLKVLHDAGKIEATNTMVSTLYRDATVGSEFVEQQVQVARIRNRLAENYDHIQVFTARDIQDLDYFPKPRPDLFISLKNGDTVTRFFLEYIPSRMADSSIRKRLDRLVRHYKDDTWSDTDTSYPTILFVAETRLVEAGLRRQIGRMKYNSDEDIAAYTSSLSELSLLARDGQKIWTDPADKDTPLSLLEL